MNRPQADAVIAAVMAHYPGVALSEASQNAYATALMPLSPKQAMQAALEVARREERFPSVAALLRGIGEVISGAPSAEDAWAEVRASFPLHYCFTTGCDYGGWEPSHPVVRRTVEAIGYHSLLHGTNPSADRAQFTRTYNEFRTQAARKAAAGCLPAPADVKVIQIGERADTADAGGPRSGIAASMKASTT